MEIWRVESNPVKQFMAVTFLFVLGILLLIRFWNFDASGFTNSLAGFLLGVLLVVICLGSLFSTYKQIVTVNPESHEIIVESLSVWGRKAQTIPFDTIVSTRVAFLGRRSNIFLQNYYLSLSLKDGSTYPLFFPAFFDGKGDASVAEGWKQKLDTYLFSR